MTNIAEWGVATGVKAAALACAGYWRHTLADAELGCGAICRKNAEALHAVLPSTLSAGRVGRKVMDALFGGDRAEADTIPVTLRPLFYRSRTEHGRTRTTLPEVIAPLVSKVTLMRDGRLVSPSSTVVPRDLLEPLDRTAFTIGTVDALDGCLTHSAYGERKPGDDDSARAWNACREQCRPLAAAVFRSLAGDARFERIDGESIDVGNGQHGASHAIGALYDRIEQDAPTAQLRGAARAFERS